MNNRDEMFKHQEILTPANENDEEIVNYFQIIFIEDVHISQMVERRNR